MKIPAKIDQRKIEGWKEVTEGQRQKTEISNLRHCGSRIMVSQSAQVLVLTTSDSVASHDKKDFVEVTKARTLRWRHYPGLFSWPNVSSSVLKNGREKHSELGDVMRTLPTLTGFKDGEWGIKSGNVDDL